MSSISYKNFEQNTNTVEWRPYLEAARNFECHCERCITCEYKREIDDMDIDIEDALLVRIQHPATELRSFERILKQIIQEEREKGEHWILLFGAFRVEYRDLLYSNAVFKSNLTL